VEEERCNSVSNLNSSTLNLQIELEIHFSMEFNLACRVDEERHPSLGNVFEVDRISL